MEFLTIFLSSLIGLISPTGLVVDQVAQNAIRKQFASVEQLQVRVDNAPSYQLLNGKVERVRIAGRGLFPAEEVRIEALELETDPIAVDAQRARRGKLKLKEPLQAGVRLVLTEKDLNRALRSPKVVAQFRQLGVNLLKGTAASQVKYFDFLNPQVTFLPNHRLRFQIELQERGYPDKLAIAAETGFSVEAGRKLNFLSPQIQINGKAVPSRVITSITEGLSDRLDLKALEKSKILARILQLNLDSDQLQLAAFIRVEPE